MPRLYEPVVFVETLLSDLRTSAVRTAVRSELRAGAHPFFLEQATRLATSNLEFLAARDLETAVRETLTEAKPTALIPEASESGLTRSLSRAYRDGEPIQVDRGVLHGILTEAYADMMAWHRKDSAAAKKEWEEHGESFFARALALPGMDFEVLDTLHYVAAALAETFDMKELGERERVSRFIKDRMATQSLGEFIKDFLRGWSDSAYIRTWAMVRRVLDALGEQFERPGTEFIRALLAVRPRDGDVAYYAAHRMLAGPWNRDGKTNEEDYFAAGAGFMFILTDIRKELPHREARRTLIRWLLQVPDYVRSGMSFQLAFVNRDNSMQIDERFEPFVEEVFGSEAWRAVCTYQDQSHWEAIGETRSGFKYWGKPDKSYPEYRIIERAARNPHLTRHDPNVAEAFEDVLTASGVTAEAATEQLEESLDILSGDLVVVVSHLRDEWMSVRRRSSELLGSVLPRIDIAKHSKFGDKNAACKFRIPLPDDARKVLKGTLNSEGEIFFENTPLLEASTQLLVRAAVAQTLCAVLVPSLVEEFVPPGTGSGPTIRTGRPWASRPIIRTEGEIGGTANGDDTEVRGSRLNPNIATALFRWLLGHGGGLAFRLFMETEEQIGGKPEKYFVFRAGARELLRRKQLPMSAAYIRAVRAHTQPTGAYLDGDEIRIKQMSAKAERHYGRYRRDGGRELDFSSVQKTYLLPGGVRVPLDVPRTFNQGHFISLEEAAELIFDLSLREAIRQALAR